MRKILANISIFNEKRKFFLYAGVIEKLTIFVESDSIYEHKTYLNMNKKVENALAHATDTVALEIGANAVSSVADMFKKLFPGKPALVIADGNTWKAAGEAVSKVLAEAGIPLEEPYIFTGAKLSEWSFVEKLDEVLAKTEAIAVAVGAGEINDLAKLCSHHNGRRYIIVGTSASVDGYTAYGASITKDGNKTTFACPAPLGVIFDSTVVAGAPPRNAASGYADMLAKIPAGADWILASALTGEKFDEVSFSLVQDGLKESLSDPAGVRSGDLDKIAQLCEGLALSGFAMQASQSTRVASGVEHYFSHLWDMEHLMHEGRRNTHGFQVGLGSLASTALYELLFETPVEELDVEKCVSQWKSWEEMEAEIRKVFEGEPDLIARGLKETKGKYVGKDELRTQLETLKKCWPELKVKLQNQLLPFDELKKDLELAGAAYEPEQIGLSREEFRKSFLKVPYMRERFTIIDVAYRCGYLEQWLDALFGKGGRWEIV